MGDSDDDEDGDEDAGQGTTTGMPTTGITNTSATVSVPTQTAPPARVNVSGFTVNSNGTTALSGNGRQDVEMGDATSSASVATVVPGVTTTVRPAFVHLRKHSGNTMN